MTSEPFARFEPSRIGPTTLEGRIVTPRAADDEEISIELSEEARLAIQRIIDSEMAPVLGPLNERMAEAAWE